MINLVPFTGLVAGNQNTVFASNSIVITGQNGDVLVNSNVYIDGLGNIGIGTTSPSSKLDINGWTGIRAGLSVAGATTVASLVVNTGIYTNTLNVNSTANVNALTSNTGITVSGGGITVTGVSTMTGNLNINGNINVTGAINTQNANIIVVQDPIIYIGEDNPGNLWDMGLVASYNSGTYYHTGFVRNKNDGAWTVFDTLPSEPNVITGQIEWSNASITYGLFKTGNINIVGNARSTSGTTGALVVNGVGGIGVGGNINVGGTTNYFAGNVGINQANPAFRLDVTGDIRATNYVYGNTAFIGPTLQSTSTSDLTINHTGAYSVSFWTNNTERMRVSPTNGYVGIGTFSPGSLLDVNGIASIRSAMSVAGTASVSSLVSNGAVSGTTGTFSGALYSASFNTAGIATVNSLVSNGAISGTTGAFSSALTLTSAAPQINLNNGTSNWIAWNTNGTAAPTFTTSSIGTKLILYPNIGASTVDFAIGMEANTMWFSTFNTASGQFKWYGGTTQAMLLSGAGALSTTSTTTSTAFIPSGSGTPTNGMFLPTTNAVGFATNSTERIRIDATGSVGIGTATPGALLGINGVTLIGNQTNAGTTGSMRLVSTGGISYIQSGQNTTAGSAAPLVFTSINAANEWMRIDSVGNVGIGTATITAGYKLQVQGGFAAITKSFVIEHPTKPGMKLRYGSLEGPENGVYVRGRTKDGVIRLPDHWRGLVDEDSITVNLTAIGRKQELYVREIRDNEIIVGGGRRIDCYYTVFAERKDVGKLEVEF